MEYDGKATAEDEMIVTSRHGKLYTLHIGTDGS